MTSKLESEDRDPAFTMAEQFGGPDLEIPQLSKSVQSGLHLQAQQ
jgi:hypothetical protein